MVKLQSYRPRSIQNILTVEAVNETPSFAQAKYRKNKTIGHGLKYEWKGHLHLLDKYGYEYVPGPWFRYSTEQNPTRINYVQPDGLIVRLKEGIVTIVEFKWSHTVDAYYQLVDRYLPLMEHFFGKDFEFHMVEICRWYSPQIQFPGKAGLKKDIDRLTPGEVGIHIWKP